MTDSDILVLLVALLCVTLSFLFSGMETGVLALNRFRIRQLMRSGDRRATVLHGFLENPEDFLWTILVGNTVVNFVIFSLGVMQLRQWIGHRSLAEALVWGAGVFIFYIVCELAPKTLFQRYPNRLSLTLAAPFRLIHRLLAPLVAVVAWFSRGLLHWTGGQAHTGRLFGSREELRFVMQEAVPELTSEERAMINRVLDLPNLRVRHVMVPLADAVTVSADRPIAEVIALSRHLNLTRLPAVDAATKRITGIVNLEHLLFSKDVDPAQPARDYLQPAFYLPEELHLEEALRRMQRSGWRLAVVLGRDNHEAGIITLQDVLKLIFGEVNLWTSDALAANALHLLGILAIVLANGFFVAAEFALVKLRDTQLDALIVAGNRRAKLARHILRQLNSYLSATQLGITMASLGLGWLAEPVFLSLLAPPLQWLGVASPHVQKSAAFAIGFTTATFLQIVLGELGPKWFAIQRALPVALAIATPLHWFYRASYPFNWILNRAAQWLMRRVGIEPAGSPLSIHSEEELRLMLNQSRAGASRLGHEIILNALDLSHRIVRNVMRPRMEIAALDTEAGLAACQEVAEKTRYSRFPLCEGGDLDKTLGVVHIKDLFALRSQAARGKDLATVARKLIYVPETTRLEKLLQLFLERKLHLAIVVDEYGGTVGMVTLENVLEELVGQIQDEFDQEKPLLLRRGQDQWELDGALPLHELAELVGQNLSGDNVATTSGWVTQRLGGFPKVGDTLTLGAYALRVDRTDGMKVARLMLTRQPEPPKPAD